MNERIDRSSAERDVPVAVSAPPAPLHYNPDVDARLRSPPLDLNAPYVVDGVSYKNFADYKRNRDAEMVWYKAQREPANG
jgi:hypothetical protein